MDCLVDPPKPEDPSCEMFLHEKSTILQNLALRAEMVYKQLNEIPGISCAKLDGAMYAFPQVRILNFVSTQKFAIIPKDKWKTVKFWYYICYLKLLPISGFS